MCDHRFPAQYRIRRERDFRRALSRRCTVADDWLVVFAYPNDLPHPRLGLIVAHRQGNAVQRNRWKRLLREAFRLSKAQLPSSVDLVVIARGDRRPTLEVLKRSLVRLAGRAARKAFAAADLSPTNSQSDIAADKDET